MQNQELPLRTSLGDEDEEAIERQLIMAFVISLIRIGDVPKSFVLGSAQRIWQDLPTTLNYNYVYLSCTNDATYILIHTLLYSRGFRVAPDSQPNVRQLHGKLK